MTHLSEGFKTLSLPQSVVMQIVNAVKAQPRPSKKPGKFFYVPMDIQTPQGNKVGIVACIFLQVVEQNNITAQPGDVAICLSPEWNPAQNPLGSFGITDGHHRMN